MRSFFFVLSLLGVQGALSQSVKSCGGPNDHLKNPVIKLSPDPPVKGGALTIQASGTLDEVEGAFNSNVDLQITALGIVHATVKGGVPMSISPGAVSGPFSLTIGPLSLPGNVPGSTVVKGQVHVTNGKNEPIMCIDLDLTVGADNAQVAQPRDTWTCSVCAHVYDQVKDGGGVAFEDQPDTYKCPVCGSPKSAFKKAVSTQVVQPVSQPLDTWTCSVCAHVYDQVKDGGGVAFEDQPDTYKCPVCGSPKSAFKKAVFTQVVQPVSQPLDTWTCSVCAHVYDQVKDGGGVAFEDQPDTYKCPVCGSPKSAFKKSFAAPALSTVSSCGKATDHIPDFKIASSGGVITMTGTLDEVVTKASIDLDVSLHVLIISLPLKMSIPLAVSDGLIKKGAISSTVGPSTIAVSPQVKATIKGTMKINDGNGQEITCLNLDTSTAEIEKAAKAVIINV